MAYPYSFLKITFGGELEGTEEIWTCGLHMAKNNSNYDVDEFDDLKGGEVSTMASRIQSFYVNPDNRFPANMKLLWVKLALIGTNGKYLTDPAEHIYPSPVSGGSTDPFVPSTAAVITLVSDKFKDPGKYNRFYIPICAPEGANAYTLSTTNTSDIALSASIMINGFNNDTILGDLESNVVAVSQRVASYMPITSVRVGNIIDSQRRRRNKLVESYQDRDI